MAIRRKFKIRKDDTVVVLAGKDRGRTGRVVRILADKDRVLVEGVNMVKRHEKPQAALGRTGGIIEKEASVHVSNVALLGSDGKPTRIGFQYLDNGQKVRIAKKTGEQIEDKARA